MNWNKSKWEEKNIFNWSLQSFFFKLNLNFELFLTFKSECNLSNSVYQNGFPIDEDIKVYFKTLLFH